jgi:hypothetical protein
MLKMVETHRVYRAPSYVEIGVYLDLLAGDQSCLGEKIADRLIVWNGVPAGECGTFRAMSRSWPQAAECSSGHRAGTPRETSGPPRHRAQGIPRYLTQQADPKGGTRRSLPDPYLEQNPAQRDARELFEHNRPDVGRQPVEQPRADYEIHRAIAERQPLRVPDNEKRGKAGDSRQAKRGVEHVSRNIDPDHLVLAANV